ncbi:MAG: DUF3987 domain-containing protein [Thermomicrobiales bacterium]
MAETPTIPPHSRGNVRVFPHPATSAELPHLDPIAEFPVDVLPPDVQDLVLSAARSIRVPVAMVAAPLLAFAGSVIGNQVSLAIADGWIERPVLWIALVAPTGAGKSPAIGAARRPLDRLQQDQWDDWQRLHRDWEHAPRPRPAAPRLRRHFTTDITIEALIQDLQAVPGIAVVRDLDQFRSRRGEDRRRYLALWSHQPLSPTRKHASHTFVQHPVVALVGGIQPHLLPDLARGDDGFLERLLPVVSTAPARYWPAAVPPADAKGIAPECEPDNEPAPIDRLFAGLASLNALYDEPAGVTLAPDHDALQAWIAWFNDNLDRAHVAPGLLKGFYLKLPAHVARFALILQVLWHQEELDEPLPAVTMHRAIQLGEYFREQIHRMLETLDEVGNTPAPSPFLAWKVPRVLADSVHPDGWLSRTELHQRLGRPPRAEYAAVLEQLLLQGTIVAETRRPSGPGRPSEHYRVP